MVLPPLKSVSLRYRTVCSFLHNVEVKNKVCLSTYKGSGHTIQGKPTAIADVGEK